MTTTKQVPPEADCGRRADEHSPPAPQLFQQRGGRSASVGDVCLATATAVDRWLDRHSLRLLRISMGVIILGFGVLKYFPGVSPAQNLVLSTTRALSFGLMPGHLTLVLLATVECAIGLSLITGRGLRVIIYLTGLWVIGILSPLVVMPGRLFSGPDHAPTLEGQYVIKDLVLLAATLVIAKTVRRSPTPDSVEPDRPQDDDQRTA